VEVAAAATGREILPEVAQLKVAQQIVAKWAAAAELEKMETPWSCRRPSSRDLTLQAPPLRSPSHPTAAVEQAMLVDVVTLPTRGCVGAGGGTATVNRVTRDPDERVGMKLDGLIGGFDRFHRLGSRARWISS